MLRVEDIVNVLKLKVVAGHQGLKNEVKAEMLSRPGVELAGFFDFYDENRLVLIGTKEDSFLKIFPESVQKERIEKLFKFNPPAILFSVNVKIDDFTIEMANKYNVPLLKSASRTTPLSSYLYRYLNSNLSPRQSFHATLVDIFGHGTLIMGKSGIGKSETALELIKRGHILVSDDRVEVYESATDVLIGTAPDILKRYIEIRGIGIVDVVSMFGAGAYRDRKQIRLVVELELWDQNKAYDRLGIEEQKMKIFNTEVTKVTIPIMPGRNTALLVESAVMNEKAKIMGYNAAKELTEKVRELNIKKGKENGRN